MTHSPETGLRETGTLSSRITRFAQSHPAAFGLVVTFLGVAFFFPDTLVVRLIAADTMTVAVWRGFAAGLATLAFLALFARDVFAQWRQIFSLPGLSLTLMQGLGSLFFLASLGHTSAANSLLILATSPFLSAMMAWAFLGEAIGRDTWGAIIVVFAGVAVIASGSLGGGRLLGDAFALANAATIAGYYVILRKMPDQNMILPIVGGYFLTSLLALPFAPMEPLDLVQAALVFTSGGIILAGGVGLLMLGPRYLPAAEVTLVTMLEIVVGPLLVWWVLGEDPGMRSLIGGGVILAAICVHAGVRLFMGEGSQEQGAR